MIYFIGGTKFREFKYFEILNKLREKNPNIYESFFDAELKEDDNFFAGTCRVKKSAKNKKI